ncbi:MAG: aminopeptidase P N-terminal domain-containing protein, partial [Bacteroidales bacterium]|nr:aminopeptidase P N-terminal domain-containing protein [Bacteroidales bacterium]
MRYDPIDPGFFTANRKRFTALLPAGSLAVFHSNDEFPRNGDQNFPFRQQSDLFYLSGIDQEETILLLAPGHPNT